MDIGINRVVGRAIEKHCIEGVDPSIDAFNRCRGEFEMTTYVESDKVSFALALTVAGLIIAVAVGWYIPRDDGWRAFVQAIAVALAGVGSVWAGGGMKSLRRTPQEIYRDFRNGRASKMTSLQLLCFALACLVIAVVWTT